MSQATPPTPQRGENEAKVPPFGGFVAIAFAVDLEEGGE